MFAPVFPCSLMKPGRIVRSLASGWAVVSG
jgi:hypothetical protein